MKVELGKAFSGACVPALNWQIFVGGALASYCLIKQKTSQLPTLYYATGASSVVVLVSNTTYSIFSSLFKPQGTLTPNLFKLGCGTLGLLAGLATYNFLNAPKSDLRANSKTSLTDTIKRVSPIFFAIFLWNFKASPGSSVPFSSPVTFIKG